MKKRLMLFAILVFAALPLGMIQPSRTIASVRPHMGVKNAFLQKYPGDWEFKETDSGDIRSLTGGKFPHAVETPESALALIKELAPLLGVNPNDLRLSLIQPNDHSRDRSYRVEQTVAGFKVYQAEATLVGNKKTGEGLMINSTLRSVLYDGSRPKLTALEAEQALLSHFKLEAGDAGLTHPEPMLVVVRPGQAELGWVFSADLKDQGSQEIVISALTGQVLSVDSH